MLGNQSEEPIEFSTFFRHRLLLKPGHLFRHLLLDLLPNAVTTRLWSWFWKQDKHFCTFPTRKAFQWFDDTLLVNILDNIPFHLYPLNSSL
jgi:hypothetical protein